MHILPELHTQENIRFRMFYMQIESQSVYKRRSSLDTSTWVRSYVPQALSTLTFDLRM